MHKNAACPQRGRKRNGAQNDPRFEYSNTPGVYIIGVIPQRDYEDSIQGWGGGFHTELRATYSTSQ